MKTFLAALLFLGAGALFAQPVTWTNNAVRWDGGDPISVSGSITGGTCTNQVVTAIDTSGVPTCTTVTNSYIGAATIDLTTKVTGILPKANGGTGTANGALADPGGNGIVARTSLNTSINRVLTAANTSLTITNGDGVAGNPTFSTTVNVTDPGGAVVLQASSPGTTQTGAFHLGGVTNIINFDAIAVTPTDALILQNSTAATAGVTVQESPSLKQCGTAYNSVSTLSETDCWRMQVLPSTAAGITGSTLRWDRNLNAGGFVNQMTLSDGGTLTVASAVTATANDITAAAGNIITGSANTFKFGATRSKFASPADSQILMENAGNTDFGRLIWGLATSSFPSIKKESATQLSFRNGDDTAYTGAVADNVVETTANGALWTHGSISEQLTLSTVATTTDTAANLLPANSIIEALVFRITTSITTATTIQFGDATISGPFSSALSATPCGAANIAATATGVCTVLADQTGTSGPRQVAAAKLRVTTNVNPGAGVVRLTVFYRTFTPPTS